MIHLETKGKREIKYFQEILSNLRMTADAPTWPCRNIWQKKDPKDMGWGAVCPVVRQLRPAGCSGGQSPFRLFRPDTPVRRGSC